MPGCTTTRSVHRLSVSGDGALMVDGLVYRGRSDTMKYRESLTIPMDTSHTSARSARYTCVMAAVIAFLMGVGVGISVPVLLAGRPDLVFHAVGSTEKPLEVIKTLDGKDDVFVAEAMPLVHDWKSNLVIDKNDSETSTLSVIIEDKSSKESEQLSLLQDNIYWGEAIEASLPKGFSDNQVENWRQFTRKEAIVKLEEGCGRMQNRLLTFHNGTKSCCRYRQNFDQIQGEIFSFYLSRLLGITNVPPSALSVVRTSSWQWSSVGNQLALAQWAEERPVVLTKFVDGLDSAFIPSILRATSRRLHPINVELSDPQDITQLTELAQWSDLLIFDYLTGNLDRVVNNLYNMQWNPAMMDSPAHNLAKHTETGLLVFLDNESGLLHGYRLLDKYESFHGSLLQALCVFRRETADRVRQLVNKGDAGDRLNKMFRRHEPDLQDYLPPIPNKSIKILNERLRTVYKQISKCEKLYST